ncbi:leucine--tRNA ligase [Candidatus Similichlamydia epinepheli]|uniref:leucine--tRNA ligase n=1 Tax=Candidatus Similichlamydia epinepheli TaxID=1903953 RepID=UPI000D399637|nr:leucine--tRNA ligase [Candidatus Similichlamydia epinepheli]
MGYDHRFIEKKWQKEWSDKTVFCAVRIPGHKKKYILDMFPYPSGSGLHMGHLCGYTYSDVYVRYLKMMGFDVLHPMGWDSFGLPAEQYAIRTGAHPRETTKINVRSFRKQLQSMGYAYDWGRELATSHPNFYKWTQWMFSLFYKKGLAYEAEVHVNYCPDLQIALANEEVDNGFSKEGRFPVILKPLRQWMLRITKYADRLIQDLDLIDWPEEIKQQQLSWIGRKEGAEVYFSVDSSNIELSVFTTRPETLFGVSYIALAVTHPFIGQLVNKSIAPLLRAFIEKRLSPGRENFSLNGGLFLGSYARNPVNGERVPLWVADYVLPHVGSGAVMGVPAHDENDFAFASDHGLEIKVVISSEECSALPHTGDGTCFNSNSEHLSLVGLPCIQARDAAIEWLESTGKGRKKITYRLRDWLFSRQRYWGEPIPILHLEDGTIRALDLDELPLTSPRVDSYRPPENSLSPLDSVPNWVFLEDPKSGMSAKRETNIMPQWAGSCWYFLRFCDPRNEEQFCSEKAQDEWMPVDVYIGGSEHAVLHLLYARFWHKVLFDCGLVKQPEPFLKLKNPGMVLNRSFRKDGGVYVSPDEVENRGEEYFLNATGEKVISQIEKMGKSKLNGVSPDDLIKDFGADSVRLYVIFISPLEKEKIWSDDGLCGCKRFLNKVYSFWSEGKVIDCDLDEMVDFLNVFVKNFREILDEYEMWSFNTIIAKLMEIVNAAKKADCFPLKCFKVFLKLLCPLAPHLAEELWQLIGGSSLLSSESFPKFDHEWSGFLGDIVSVALCVNGKTKAVISCPKGSDKEKVLSLAQNEKAIQRCLQGVEVKNYIFVQDKILNIVTS